ncbi:MAG: pyruvate dehydrogenase (acetyl-transferring) E1 component subunit alpha [Actinobacteria bacterium]|nr:pyruvate dehydrogenase (acetyl-transferring) E1 component subunit alpha [Actinomycetota bacterium]
MSDDGDRTEQGPARSILGPGGEASIDPADLGLKEEDLRELYRLMVLSRKADLEATALQRQGQLAVYPPLLGQEAAQVGSAFALQDEDFIFPSYREMASAIVRGVDVVGYLLFHRATWHGGMFDPNEHRFGVVSVPVGSQTLHAVGYAMGTKLDGKPACTLVYFGDGATSQGDFHEACNFAAVFRAPVVFFCQNNHWAISVPFERQSVAPVYRKAEAYGFPGIQVDGNDVLAVYQATREAAERARTEHTPTLIEALTYRLGPHSTADDRTRYQPAEQIAEWEGRDPIVRYRRFLESTGAGDEAFFSACDDEANTEATRIREGVIGAGPRPLEELFEWVFADMPEHLRRQRDEVLGRGEG